MMFSRGILKHNLQPYDEGREWFKRLDPLTNAKLVGSFWHKLVILTFQNVILTFQKSLCVNIVQLK